MRITGTFLDEISHNIPHQNWGEKEWDASLDLYGMFEIEEILRTNDDLKKYIPNYTINLIDAERLENLDLFQRDLQVIFGLLKCRKDKQKLKQYVKDNKEFFKSVDMDTGMVIGAFMNSNSIINEMKKQDEGGNIDMCKAMEDWAADERAEGKAEGERIGREMGAFAMLSGLVKDGLLKLEDAAKRMNMTEEMFFKKMQDMN